MDEAIQAAREQLASDDPRVRATALYVLAERGDREAAPRIAGMPRDDDHRVRVAALHALGTLGYVEAVEQVIDLLWNKEMLVRAAAVATLAELGDRRALDPLIGCLRDRISRVRERAVEALAAFGGPDARDAVIGVLPLEVWMGVRLRIVEFLANDPSVESADALIRRLGDDDDEVRAAAAHALGKKGDVRALPALEHMAATDKGECWLPYQDGCCSNSNVAREAIAAILDDRGKTRGRDERGRKGPPPMD